jgi:transposase
VIVPGPTACACCDGTRLAKLGEDVTETLEVILRQWKVIQHVQDLRARRSTVRRSGSPGRAVPLLA